MARLLPLINYSKIVFMKKNNSILYSSVMLLSVMLLVVALLLNACGSTKNIPANTAIITQAIDSSKWKFTVNDVMPQYGTSRPANGNYDVVLSNNKLTVYLPYFGRAFSGADILSGTGPLNFTSVDFTTDKLQNKKGQWTITIKTNDYREVQTMSFSFYSNGRANLSIIMSNRSPISYTGTVEAVK